jgi:hypothetical protein
VKVSGVESTVGGATTFGVAVCAKAEPHSRIAVTARMKAKAFMGTVRNLVCEVMMMGSEGASHGDREGLA